MRPDQPAPPRSAGPAPGPSHGLTRTGADSTADQVAPAPGVLGDLPLAGRRSVSVTATNTVQVCSLRTRWCSWRGTGLHYDWRLAPPAQLWPARRPTASSATRPAPGARRLLHVHAGPRALASARRAPHQHLTRPGLSTLDQTPGCKGVASAWTLRTLQAAPAGRRLLVQETYASGRLRPRRSRLTVVLRSSPTYTGRVGQRVRRPRDPPPTRSAGRAPPGAACPALGARYRRLSPGLPATVVACTPAALPTTPPVRRAGGLAAAPGDGLAPAATLELAYEPGVRAVDRPALGPEDARPRTPGRADQDEWTRGQPHGLCSTPKGGRRRWWWWPSQCRFGDGRRSPRCTASTAPAGGVLLLCKRAEPRHIAIGCCRSARCATVLGPWRA
ncbi:hypothetical protein QJS66_17180 [Kocuria rhizophila]|nr:hypothetical protein QJS66_17180 [Kocuria rhizophila]